MKNRYILFSYNWLSQCVQQIKSINVIKEWEKEVINLDRMIVREFYYKKLRAFSLFFRQINVNNFFHVICSRFSLLQKILLPLEISFTWFMKSDSYNLDFAYIKLPYTYEFKVFMLTDLIYMIEIKYEWNIQTQQLF